MKNTTTNRFEWAVQLMNIKPGRQVLEIGCGAGLLAEQICLKIGNGKLTAIDRSAPMIAKAKKRNAAFIIDKKVIFIDEAFESVHLPVNTYHSIAAFNVNLFLKGSAEVFEKVRKALKPAGRIFIFYQAPYEINIRAADPIIRHLENNAFEVEEKGLQKFDPYPAIYVIAKRK